jgi:hypothetical protein
MTARECKEYAGLTPAQKTKLTRIARAMKSGEVDSKKLSRALHVKAGSGEKRPLSSYMLFAKQNRAAVARDLKTSDVTAVAMELGRLWKGHKAANDEVFQRFSNEAQRERQDNQPLMSPSALKRRRLEKRRDNESLATLAARTRARERRRDNESLLKTSRRIRKSSGKSRSSSST